MPGHRHTPPALGTCPCPSPLTQRRQTRLSVTRHREGAGEARQGVIPEPSKQAPGGAPRTQVTPRGLHCYSRMVSSCPEPPAATAPCLRGLPCRLRCGADFPPSPVLALMLLSHSRSFLWGSLYPTSGFWVSLRGMVSLWPVLQPSDQPPPLSPHPRALGAYRVIPRLPEPLEVRKKRWSASFAKACPPLASVGLPLLRSQPPEDTRTVPAGTRQGGPGAHLQGQTACRTGAHCGLPRGQDSFSPPTPCSSGSSGPVWALSPDPGTRWSWDPGRGPRAAHTQSVLPGVSRRRLWSPGRGEKPPPPAEGTGSGVRVGPVSPGSISMQTQGLLLGLTRTSAPASTPQPRASSTCRSPRAPSAVSGSPGANLIRAGAARDSSSPPQPDPFGDQRVWQVRSWTPSNPSHSGERLQGEAAGQEAVGLAPGGFYKDPIPPCWTMEWRRWTLEAEQAQAGLGTLHSRGARWKPGGRVLSSRRFHTNVPSDSSPPCGDFPGSSGAPRSQPPSPHTQDRAHTPVAWWAPPPP